MDRTRRRVVTLLIALLADPLVHANVTGTVVGVSDGDTITVLDDSKKQHKIRLSGIDAPEKGQAFGQRAKEYLSDRVYRKSVVVEGDKTDRYGRTVGKVVVDGRDVCLEMVEAGYAWHFKKYQREQSRSDRALYAAAENASRDAKRGLWRDVNPIAPWEWRKGQRSD